MPRRTALVLLALALFWVGLPAGAAAPDPALDSGPAAVAPWAAAIVVPPTALRTADRAAADRAAADRLAARVNAALSTSSAGTIGAAVDVAGWGAVLRRDAGHLLPPASTQKSFTALAALWALPAGTRFTTEVAARAEPTRGLLPGSIWLVAGGDPYLTQSGLRGLARRVRAAGVRYVAGDLLLDDSRYDPRRRAAGWDASYMPYEAGPLSALSVDQNQWRRDGAFLADPALPAARLFRSYLRAEGVTVHGVVKRMRRPVEATRLASWSSGPLAAVLRRTLKESNNFAAELIGKEVGRAVRDNGSSAAGHAAVRDVLRARGVPAGAGADASGLSSYDRQSAVAQLDLLHAADNSPSSRAFRATLPVACRDGTLRRRMCNTAAAGRVLAKTGTLSGVRAMSGYTWTASGRSVWFSFQLTGVTDSAAAGAALDAAAVALASASN